MNAKFALVKRWSWSRADASIKDWICTPYSCVIPSGGVGCRCQVELHAARRRRGGRRIFEFVQRSKSDSQDGLLILEGRQNRLKFPSPFPVPSISVVGDMRLVRQAAARATRS